MEEGLRLDLHTAPLAPAEPDTPSPANNLGGFIGPSVVGYVLSKTHSYPLGMLILASGNMLAGFVLMGVRVKPQEASTDMEQQPS